MLRDDRLHHFASAIPLVRQTRDTWCGAAVAQAILMRFGRGLDQHEVAAKLGTNERGTNVSQMVGGLRAYGLNAIEASTMYQTMDQIAERMQTSYEEQAPREVALVIRGYGRPHWVALVGWSSREWYFMDPYSETGYSYVHKRRFAEYWTGKDAVITWQTVKTKRRVFPTPKVYFLTEVPLN